MGATEFQRTSMPLAVWGRARAHLWGGPRTVLPGGGKPGLVWEDTVQMLKMAALGHGRQGGIKIVLHPRVTPGNI